MTSLGITTIVTYGTSQYLFSLLIEPVRAEFGAARATLGLAYAGGALLAAIAGAAVGPIVDRRGARWVLVAGSAISAATLLGLAQARDAATFDALWIVGTGIGSALTWYPVTFTVVANWFDVDRPRALARLTFLGAFSSTIFYPLSAALIAHAGWRGALTALACVHLAIALPLHLAVVRRHPEDRGLFPDGAGAAQASHPASGTPARAALRTPTFWFLTVALGLASFAAAAVLVMHVAFMTSRGYTLGAASLLAGVLGIAYVPGRWLVGRLAATVPLGRLLAGTLALEGAAVAVLAAQRGYVWIALYVVAFGMTYGAMAPLRGTIVATLFGRRAYGTIIAVQGVAVGVAAAAGPYVLTAVADGRGYGAALWCAAFVLVAAAIVAAAAPLRAPE